jgi:hypothetical protein
MNVTKAFENTVHPPSCLAPQSCLVTLTEHRDLQRRPSLPFPITLSTSIRYELFGKSSYLAHSNRFMAIQKTLVSHLESANYELLHFSRPVISTINHLVSIKSELFRLIHNTFSPQADSFHLHTSSQPNSYAACLRNSTGNAYITWRRALYVPKRNRPLQWNSPVLYGGHHAR